MKCLNCNESLVVKTSVEHSNIYGLTAKNPLFVTHICLGEGIDNPDTLNIIEEYAKKNNNDLIFGHLGSFVKDYFYIHKLRKWLEGKGYNFAPNTTDFYKHIPTNLPYYDEFYTNIKD